MCCGDLCLFGKLFIRASRQPAGIFLVLVLGIALSFGACALLRRWEKRSLEDRTAEIVREQLASLQVSMQRSIEALYSIASLRASERQVAPEQFRDFVEGSLQRQEELLALSWNPVVVPEQRRSVEEFYRLQIKELDSSGKLSPASTTGRDRFVPVALIEPRDANEKALGYDLASDPVRRGALERACDSGKAVATSTLRLAQESSDQPGLLVVLPIYSSGLPQTVLERRERITGYAVAVFRARDLVGEAFAQFRHFGIDLELRDTAADGPVIERTRDKIGPLSASSEFIFAEHRWVVRYSPGELAATSWQSWLVLVAGFLFTALTSGFLWLDARRGAELALANQRLEIEVRERKHAEQMASNASKAKSDFLASMSHELRTPLNAMMGYAQIMQKDPHLGHDHRDSVSGILGSGQHLFALINEVLDLSRIEAGRMELQIGDFHLGLFCKGIEATFRPLCAQKKIALTVRAPAAENLWLRGDEVKLRQISINLLGNAVKFTNAGEVGLCISTDGGGFWRFEVFDTGMGIPPEERAQIFEPFHQGKGSQHHGGTGLGLAIAKRQVKLMGGNLEFQTERGVGTRFFFAIPLSHAEPRSLDEPSKPSAETPIPWESARLPLELAERFMIAAELHSATALKACLVELRSLGAEHASLGEEIRRLMRSYDMDAIHRLIVRGAASVPSSQNPSVQNP